MFFGKDSQAERLSCGGFRHKALILKDISGRNDIFANEWIASPSYFRSSWQRRAS